MADRAADPLDADVQRARKLPSREAIRALAADRWAEWRPRVDLSLLAVFVILMALVVGPSSTPVAPIPPLESVASETVRSARDILVEDRAATAFRRRVAAETAPVVYEYDPDLYFAIAAPVQAAFDKMARRKREATLARADRLEAFQRDLALPVNAATFALIEEIERPEDVASAITHLYAAFVDKTVIADGATLAIERGIVTRNLADGAMRELAEPADALTLSQAKRMLRENAEDAPFGSARIVRSFVQDAALRLMRPNLMYNDGLTSQLRESAIAGVEPVYVRIGGGEVVVRAGERVTAAVQERLKVLYAASAEHSAWRELVALAALVLALIGLGGLYFRHESEAWPVSPRKTCYLTLAAAAAVALICLAALHLGLALTDALGLDAKNAAYLLPVSLTVILTRPLVDGALSLIAGVSLALLFAYRVDGDLWLLTYYLLGILAAGVAMRWCHRREDLLKVGFLVGVAHLLAAPVVITLASPPPGGIAALLIAPGVFALVSGVLAGVAAMLLLPILEHIFEEATDMRLIELASADNPLLKELAMRSPGTYYRSILIANLAESAGEAIGANGPRCRAMALYHDLGKAVRPSYFSENQRGRNIHDRLPPELSARIVFAHIKDGIDIARKHRLGQAIVDAISQHQGTELLAEFHEKAAAVRRGGGAVAEDDFRCPGPKPRSKEAGVLLLADAVEAATRSLKDPAADQLRARIDKVVDAKLAEGELDDCALGIGDLARVKDAFRRVLELGVFHNRIDYPPLSDRPIPTNHDPRHTLLDRLRALAGRAS